MNLHRRDHMNDHPAPDAALDAAIQQAFEQTPSLAIPSDFAARVAHLATRQPTPVRRPWLGWGPRLALGSGALLTLAMFALAPHAVPSLANFRFDAELLLLTELGGLLLFAHRLIPHN